MPKIVIVFHSGYGHTAKVAQAVAEAAAGSLLAIDAEGNLPEGGWETLAAADAIVFGSPTYMGSASWQFKKFADASSKPWFMKHWRNKLAAGFTVSASWNGDKHNTLYQMLTLAVQHGMVWVGLGLPPGNNSSKGSVADLNRVGASIGAMGQANADQGVEGIGASDFKTFEALGRRVAEAARRWHEAPLARAA